MTTAKKTTTSTKSTKTKTASPKPAKSVTVVEEKNDDKPVELALTEKTELKKKELLEMVVERCGVKKKDAKPALEATLAVLGEALREGRELNLQPLGKLKVTRMKQVGNGVVTHARIRHSTQANASAETAADTDTSETAETDS